MVVLSSGFVFCNSNRYAYVNIILYLNKIPLMSLTKKQIIGDVFVIFIVFKITAC